MRIDVVEKCAMATLNVQKMNHLHYNERKEKKRKNHLVAMTFD
jgi:hypothetical protein